MPVLASRRIAAYRSTRLPAIRRIRSSDKGPFARPGPGSLRGGAGDRARLTRFGAPWGVVWPGLRQGGECRHRGCLDRRDVIEEQTRFGVMVRASRCPSLPDDIGTARTDQPGFGEEIPSL